MNYKFHTAESKILAWIIQGCCPSRVRRKFVQENCTWKQLLDKARAMEIIEARVAKIKKENQASAMYSQDRSGQQRERKRSDQHQHCYSLQCDSKKYHNNTACQVCGGPQTDTSCLIKGKKYNNCHKLNHFVNVCWFVRQNKKVRQISSNLSLRGSRSDLSF